MAQNVSATACGLPVGNVQKNFITADLSILSVSSFFILSRFLYKIIYTPKDIWWDDFCLLMTFCFSIAGSVVSIRGLIPNGLGLDIWAIPFKQIKPFIIYNWVEGILYFFDLMFLRLSLLFFFARIFSVGKSVIVIYATMAFNVCFSMACILSVVFSCQPITRLWTKYAFDSPGTCIDTTALTWSNAAIGIALDVWMLTIPFYNIRKLQLPRSKKFMVAPMFLVGFAATIVAILRLKTLTTITKTAYTNPTMNRVDMTIWSIAELGVGIACACMPTLRLILVRIFPRLSSSTSNSAKYSVSQRAADRKKSLSARRMANSCDHTIIKRQISIDQQFSDAESMDKAAKCDIEAFDEVIVGADGTIVSRPKMVGRVVHSDDEMELLDMNEHGQVKFDR